MTHKTLVGKVYLSELKKGQEGTRDLILRGRGLCLMGKKELYKKDTPVCAVFDLIAEYFAYPPRPREHTTSGSLATELAKRKMARALEKRFVIRGRNIGPNPVSHDALVRSFVSQLEHAFYSSAPRDALEYKMDALCATARLNLEQHGVFDGRSQGESVLEDRENLVRVLLNHALDRHGLRRADNALKQRTEFDLRKIAALDLLVSRTWEPSVAEYLIKEADRFALQQLSEGEIISCANCKQAERLWSGRTYFQGRKILKLPLEAGSAHYNPDITGTMAGDGGYKTILLGLGNGIGDRPSVPKEGTPGCENLRRFVESMKKDPKEGTTQADALFQKYSAGEISAEKLLSGLHLILDGLGVRARKCIAGSAAALLESRGAIVRAKEALQEAQTLREIVEREGE